MNRNAEHRDGELPVPFPARIGIFLYPIRGWTALIPIPFLLILFRPRTGWIAAGAVSIALGEAIRIAALRQIGGASRSRRLGAERLVTEGIFRRLRNPLYMGNFFLAAGFGLLSGRAWFVPIVALLFAIQYAPIVLAEEHELRRRFGGAYIEYARVTPRFVPRFPGGSGKGNAPRYSLAEAIRFDRSALRAIAVIAIALAARAVAVGGN